MKYGLSTLPVLVLVSSIVLALSSSLLQRKLTFFKEKLQTASVLDNSIQKELTTPPNFFVIALSPDGKKALIRGNPKWTSYVQVWDLETEQIYPLRDTSLIAFFLASSHSTAVFSSDNKTLLFLDHHHTVFLYDSATQKELLKLQGEFYYANGVLALSPDGKQAAIGSEEDNIIYLYDLHSKQQVWKLKGHSDRPWSVAFSPQGKALVTGSRDKTARVWDLETGAELLCLKGHTKGIRAVAFSPDSQTILTGSADHSVRLWDAHTGKELGLFTGHTGAVFAVAFNPTGTRILTGSADHTARLWDVETKKELATLKRHPGFVYAVAFSPDEKTIITTSSKTVRIEHNPLYAKSTYDTAKSI